MYRFYSIFVKELFLSESHIPIYLHSILNFLILRLPLSLQCRDSAYIAVLTSVLSDALTSPTFDLDILYENSIAMVALEEVIGVREPRLACTKGYQTALRNTVLLLTQKGQSEVSFVFLNS